MDILQRAQSLHPRDLELGCLIRRGWVRNPHDLARAAELPVHEAAAALDRLRRVGVIRWREEPRIAGFWEVPENAIFLVAGQCG